MPCRLNFAHQWGVRIMHEAKCHDNNIFMTLTYDDEHIPLGDKGNPTLKKQDFQEFMKRLRYYVSPDKIRFFGCGEYGSSTFGTKRPHYHVIIFGLSVYDKRIFSNVMYDYKSKGYYVNCKAWDKGLVHVGSVAEGSANYVAHYTLKKVKGKDAAKYYTDLGILPEFSLMSNRPGIGYDYMQKYGDEFIRDGYIIQQGSKVAIPRYYTKKLDITNTEPYLRRLEEQEAQHYQDFVDGKIKPMTFDQAEQLREQLKYHYDYLMNFRGKK